jgi:hypothetical protein
MTPSPTDMTPSPTLFLLVGEQSWGMASETKAHVGAITQNNERLELRVGKVRNFVRKLLGLRGEWGK